MTKSNTQVTTSVDALNRSLEAPPLDPVVLALANDYLSGQGVNEIADEYGISEDRVTAVIEKKEVKNYIDSVFATQGYLNRIKRINLINSVIDQKIQEAVETGIYSKKDLLDWMKHLQEVETSLKPKTQGPQVAVQINNYDKLMRDLME
jgi:DNA-binding MarR family transcriptional regulator